jgi:hypothetical protein
VYQLWYVQSNLEGVTVTPLESSLVGLCKGLLATAKVHNESIRDQAQRITDLEATHGDTVRVNGLLSRALAQETVDRGWIIGALKATQRDQAQRITDLEDRLDALLDDGK